ncbi:hypothetical protein FOTG_02644 [Fusarium oxysporum f. sp. vasinfectum 25433]|uniref:Uncharacterized protein n=1 Tax=Fusarium oxysporum f. sp. vasinfectum 25433 TaxID=1089449 RepID=X0MKV7_FUSOX|nr:hypothetical protein FOTG_02644 [Fusarium oxysporum f. sp. vasinfectum 25433]
MPDLRTCQGWLRQEVIEMIEKTVRDTEKKNIFIRVHEAAVNPLSLPRFTTLRGLFHAAEVHKIPCQSTHSMHPPKRTHIRISSNTHTHPLHHLPLPIPRPNDFLREGLTRGNPGPFQPWPETDLPSEDPLHFVDQRAGNLGCSRHLNFLAWVSEYGFCPD